MKWPLVAYKVGLAIFFFVILLIAAMAVMPVLEGDISVEREGRGMDWSLENETITGRSSVWINNTGYLDFEKIVFDLDAEVLDDFHIDSTQRVGDISSGEEKKVDLIFSENLSEVPDDVKTHLLRYDTEVNVTVKMDGQYTFSLFTFTAEREDVFQWDAPFHDLSVSDVSYSQTPPEAEVDVSFENHYREELGFDITVEIFDPSGGVVGSTTETYTVPAGGSFHETITVEFSGELDHAIVRFEKEESGMSYEEEVEI